MKHLYTIMGLHPLHPSADVGGQKPAFHPEVTSGSRPMVPSVSDPLVLLDGVLRF